jgi:hypothetical protein
MNVPGEDRMLEIWKTVNRAMLRGWAKDNEGSYFLLHHIAEWVESHDKALWKKNKNQYRLSEELEMMLMLRWS